MIQNLHRDISVTGVTNTRICIHTRFIYILEGVSYGC